MKKYEFTNELTEKAFKVYSDSSFIFWVDNNGDFFYSDNPQSEKVELGTLQDVINFLESFAEEEEMEGRMVKNEYGVNIDYEVAESLMDGDLREKVAYDISPCTDQEFFDAYAKAHQEKFGETWELAKENPCY